VKKTTLII